MCFSASQAHKYFRDLASSHLSYCSWYFLLASCRPSKPPNRQGIGKRVPTQVFPSLLYYSFAEKWEKHCLTWLKINIVKMVRQLIDTPESTKGSKAEISGRSLILRNGQADVHSICYAMGSMLSVNECTVKGCVWTCTHSYICLCV